MDIFQSAFNEIAAVMYLHKSLLKILATTSSLRRAASLENLIYMVFDFT